MDDLIDRDALLLKQKAHADLFADSTVHDDIVRRDEATAALAEIINAPAVNRWIPCSESLPEKSGEYLVYTENEDVFNCYFEEENVLEEDECQWGFYQDYLDPDTLGWVGTTWTAVEIVTHWMPLPKPPEQV